MFLFPLNGISLSASCSYMTQLEKYPHMLPQESFLSNEIWLLKVCARMRVKSQAQGLSHQGSRWPGIAVEPFNHSGEKCCHSGSKTLWSFWDRHTGARLLILAAQTSLSYPPAIDSTWVRTIGSTTQLIVYRANIHKELVKKHFAHMVMVSNK